MEEIESRFCNETGCVRRVILPHLYCDKHVDKSSDPYAGVEKDVLDELLAYIEPLDNKEIAKILVEYSLNKIKEKK